jgi:hypothetical protein
VLYTSIVASAFVVLKYGILIPAFTYLDYFLQEQNSNELYVFDDWPEKFFEMTAYPVLSVHKSEVYE